MSICFPHTGYLGHDVYFLRMLTKSEAIEIAILVPEITRVVA